MTAKKPIDRQFLLDSLKNFDQEILSKKYSNNSPEEKVTKEMVESLLLSEAALSETLAVGDMVPIVNADESGHRSVAKLTTIDSLATEVAGKIDIPDIPDTPTEPFELNFNNYPALEDDLQKTDKILVQNAAEGSTPNTVTLGKLMENFNGSVDFADVPEATELTADNYAVVGTETEMQKIKMNPFLDFIRENGLFELDGKGRPLLPGYGIKTVKVLANFTNGFGETGKTYTELFGIENRDDIIFVYGYTLNDPDNQAIDSAVIDSVTGEVTFANRGGSNAKNIAIHAFCIYKIPVPYEPGMRSITKEFTISASASKSGIICNVSDFGVDIEDVISFVVHCKNKDLLFLYSLIPPEYIKWNYPNSALDFSNVTFSVTLTIKDYSSIGPSIVTDGIRVVTKTITKTLVPTDGSDGKIAICNLNVFDVNKDDIVGMTGYSTFRNTDFVVGYPVLLGNDIIWVRPNNTGIGVTEDCYFIISLIVKIPDIEEGPPIGEIISYMGTTAPNKFLICDGTAYNISDYPQLAQHFTDQFGAVNHFGGDGTTTFAVPDLRGEFLRGTGTATRNTGTGAVVGEHQDATLHANVGSVGTSSDGWVGAFAGAGGISPTNIGNRNADATFGNSIGIFLGTNSNREATFKGKPTTFTSRPTNTAVLYCIRAKK